MATGSKAFSELITPYNTSEFHRLAEQARRHHHANHDAYVIIAHELYRSLSKVQGRSWALGADSRYHAKQVTRHFIRAAGEELQAARCVVAAYRKFTELYTDTPAAARGRSFDVNR